MEHDLDALIATNPITGNIDKLSALLADQAEMKLLHMVTKSPARTPTFTMFGNDNYFFFTASGGDCVNRSGLHLRSGFAGCDLCLEPWRLQKDITRTWFAAVGPGVRHLGRHDAVFSDHTDVRPTLIALLGLKDDYVHDGRVLAEWLEFERLAARHQATSGGLHRAGGGLQAA